MTCTMEGLLLQVLRASERAANIARLCRQERALFELLVEEKLGEAKNTRFRHDFKTLADVLIQESAKHYLTKMVGVGRLVRRWQRDFYCKFDARCSYINLFLS